MKSPFVFVECDILQSAFSGEKIFEVPTVDGGLFVGAVPVDFCKTYDGSRFGTDEPPRDQRARGLVSARVVRNGGDRARVAFPDGEDAEVSTQLLRQREQEDVNVPV
jgi:hypothetical protein